MTVVAMLLQFLFVIGAIALILIILVQRPQGGGLSAAFGGGAGSQSAFGAKTGDALTISTVAIFVFFLVVAVSLVLVNRSLFAGQVISPPTMPSGLTVEVMSDTEMKISWVDESETETGFEIERATQLGLMGNWMIVDLVEEDLTTFFDRDLTPGTMYYYRISAVNDVGESPSIGPTSGTTTGVSPEAPETGDETMGDETLPGDEEDSAEPAAENGPGADETVESDTGDNGESSDSGEGDDGEQSPPPTEEDDDNGSDGEG